ncbi:hypothetical protein E5Q_01801 [Mixia osmundae IAM 14324]|uniref:ACT domain-containing protein n=1 Tax=Mixia osmundae (strain CBS 9802 / IAM 14324 / JCM 22182 / KY 12970) TaxID=764103 RepID=G7DX49_MIXOS|nr:hypothetical protein E5Q_01801 [Mixia osmundae IAM 14324]
MKRAARALPGAWRAQHVPATRGKATLRFAARSAPFSSSAAHQRAQHDEPTAPGKPTKPVQSATSALDYKMSHPAKRPPRLPTIDPPKWSAEEAVTNILYNTPPPSNQPFVRHVLNCLVQNEPGVLSRVSGILAARGFNIDSLVVCATEIKDLSRMCIVLRGQDGVIEQARRQLEDLVPVWAVLDYTRTKTIERELLLCKVSILGPEYFEDQLRHKIQEGASSPHAASQEGEATSPDHASGGDPGLAIQSEIHRQYDAEHHAQGYATPTFESLSPSEALRQKHAHMSAIALLASQFQGKIVDISNDAAVVEVSGKTERIDAFLKLIRPYGVLEAARTGTMVMPRAPIISQWSGMSDEEPLEEETVQIDASQLPPG